MDSVERPHSRENRPPLSNVLPPAGPHDPRTDHAIVTEAYGWLVEQNGDANLTHGQVGDLIATWEHFDELTMPDMVNLLRRFSTGSPR